MTRPLGKLCPRRQDNVLSSSPPSLLTGDLGRNAFFSARQSQIKLTGPHWTAAKLKKRKKLEPTSIAPPAASASSIAFDEVIPLPPSGRRLFKSRTRSEAAAKSSDNF
jgi:hypothetical protein